jgi:hypothetical protein
MSVAKDASGVERDERQRRRVSSDEEKHRIVAETLEPGASVSIVARRHDWMPICSSRGAVGWLPSPPRC